MEKLGVFLGAIGVLILTAVLLALPVQWLWNECLVGAVEGVHEIRFWQALGITFLFNMLFKPNNK